MPTVERRMIVRPFRWRTPRAVGIHPPAGTSPNVLPLREFAMHHNSTFAACQKSLPLAPRRVFHFSFDLHNTADTSKPLSVKPAMRFINSSSQFLTIGDGCHFLRFNGGSILTLRAKLDHHHRTAICETLHMSHEVQPIDLRETAGPYGATPYLLSTSRSGAPRVNQVVARFDIDQPAVVHLAGYGRGLEARLTDDTALSLLWPQQSLDGFSLIADGTAVLEDGELAFTVASAVLHRPAPLDGSASC